MQIDISGIEGVQAALNAITDDMSARIARGVALAGKEVEAAAQARAPEDTGVLIGSIHSKAQGNTAIISDGVEYGIYQEFGTRYQKGKPHLVPALKEKEAKIYEIIKNEVMP